MTHPSAIEIVAITPRGTPSAAIAVAAGRAGATGVVDLCELGAPAGTAVIDDLIRLGTPGRLGARHESARALADLPPEITGVVLAAAHLASVDHETLTQGIAQLRDQHRRVLVEVTSPAQGAAAHGAGADALIAKGNEAGGHVGQASTFVLVQALADLGLPVIALGGIGLHTAGACLLAGAAGFALDGQLLLSRETPLEPGARRLIGRLDGSETICVGAELGERWRVLEAAGRRHARELRDKTSSANWAGAIRSNLGWSPDECLMPVGQDAALAAPLAERFETTGAIVTALRDAAREHIRTAAARKALVPGAPLAGAHGTELPVAQGPMTRVSDEPAFAAAVADAGGLPFLALALKSEHEVERLLAETHRQLGDRPFGVGILGFVPHELRLQQWSAIRRRPPGVALIAGGRPDQALAFEREGIPTYLHVPSPALLEMFVQSGARRFVFEGRECGGHVGPRASLLLWQQMVGALLDAVPAEELETLHVLLAGGIHDARSAAAAAASAAPLSAAGARIGVLMGTAYLFTREVVASGAIVPEFQAQAIGCQRTALLETAPGHATRCAATPFAQTFQAEKARLEAQNAPPEAVSEHLERLNLGRLRVAAKGVTRDRANGTAPSAVAPEVQRTEGLYMLGQVATLRAETTGLAELHHAVTTGATELTLSSAAAHEPPAADPPPPCDVAIVGMSCLLPGAQSLHGYWANIVGGVDAITEIPPERWPLERYFSEDPAARDRVYARWGGFLDEVPFDPVGWGMPPASVRSIEPLQLLSLEAARAALRDAELTNDRLPRGRTSVIIGAGGGVADLGHRYALRAGLPLLVDHVPEPVLERLPEWTEDSFAGVLLNVAAGRIANRLDLGGTNYTVDAACASSLAAVHLACRELESRASDVVIAGGADTMQNPFGYMCFAKTHALSPTGRCRTFDAAADGIAISEGVVMVVLKRLDDAERDGDRIYAVVKAVEGSSDGSAKGLTAPHPAGQARALHRAYARAHISPATVGLVEAHGTGTVVGDRAEVETLRSVYEAAGAAPGACAIGSVKSMIGHTKCAAGLAGMVKAALALHQQVLPSTINVETPNREAEFGRNPFYVSSRTRPWIRPAGGRRRAAVSAFGFGGTNFHAVLEEYDRGHRPGDRQELAPWPAELLVMAAPSTTELQAELGRLEKALDGEGELDLGGLARSAWERFGRVEGARLAIVVSDLDQLRERIRSARQSLVAEQAQFIDGWLSDGQLGREGSLAFLYPGQGSQHCDMLVELALRFGEVRDAFARGDAALAGALDLSRHVFPPARFSDDEARADERALRDTRVAQPALGATAVAMTALLGSLGIRPAVVAGHSYGEYPALWRAGALSEADLFALSAARGRAIADAAAGGDLGAMAAVAAPADRVTAALNGDGVSVANLNGPRQTVIAGPTEPLARAVAELEQRGLDVRPLPVACAFHSEVVRPAADRLARELAAAGVGVPRLPVYANATGAPYPDAESACRELLVSQLVAPVRFGETVEAMWRDGVRIFVEAGPKSVLTGLVGDILADRPHLAVAPGAPHDDGLVSLLRALGRLFVHGVEVDLARLFSGRPLSDVSLAQPLRRPPECPPTTWLVSGGSTRPASEPRAPAAPPLPTAAIAAPPDDEPSSARQTTSVPDLEGLSGADRVMVAYQRVMARIVESQEALMHAYLGGAPAPPATPAAASPEPNRAPAEPQPAAPERQPAAPEPPAPADDALSALTAVVSERTGYPPDLLDPDAELEADLGIDSIKKVEVIGALRRTWAQFAAAAAANPETLEELTTCRTLRALADRVTALTGVAPDAGATIERQLTSNGNGDAGHRADAARIEINPSAPMLPPRFIATTTAASRNGENAAVPAGAIVLIIDDRQGTGEALARGIHAAGGVPVLVREPPELADEQAVAELLERVRAEHGPIGGVIHTLPLRALDEPATLELSSVREILTRDLRSLFVVARELSEDLNRSGGFLVAATALGRVAHGAIHGLLRALAREWPDVRVAAVAPDPAATPADRAAQILAELAQDTTDVSYADGRRLAPATTANGAAGAPVPPPADCVVLVTGGCGAVGARISVELARRYNARIVLVGRSPLPTVPESEETAGLNDAALRAAVAESLRRSGEHVRPAEIERVSQAIVRERAIRSALEEIAEAGGRPTYIEADVRDHDAFGRAIESIYHEHGRIDVAIHAAGVLADGRFETRTLADLEAVIATKVDGALVLARRLRPETLHSLVLFGSVAGRFGNAGQSLYAAANAALDSIAADLDGRWPARVVAIDWGPWLGGGMVTAEVEQRFRELGIEPIEPAAGARALVRELETGHKGESEVVIGRGPWQNAPPRPPRLLRAPGRRSGGATEFARALDPHLDLFLDHHRLDGRPVLPAAFALEMMAEAYTAAGAGADAFEVHDFRVLRGIVLDRAPAEVTVTVERPSEGDTTIAVTEAGAARISYRATFAQAPLVAPPGAPARLENAPVDVAEAYDSWLFHGPSLRGIAAIEAAGPEGVDAVLTVPETPAIAEHETGAGATDYVLDPVLVDSAFQLSIVWARTQADATTLPAGFRRMRRFAPVGAGPLRCTLRGRPGPAGANLEVTLELRHPGGAPVLLIEGAEFTATRSLNRLADAAAGGTLR